GSTRSRPSRPPAATRCATSSADGLSAAPLTALREQLGSVPSHSGSPVIERPSHDGVMFDRLAELARELEKLESSQADLFASGDQQAAIEAGRRIAELTPVVEVYREHLAVAGELAEAREMA